MYHQFDGILKRPDVGACTEVTYEFYNDRTLTLIENHLLF